MLGPQLSSYSLYANGNIESDCLENLWPAIIDQNSGVIDTDSYI